MGYAQQTQHKVVKGLGPRERVYIFQCYARMLRYVRAVELYLTMLVFALDSLGLGFGLGLPIWASSAMLQVWVLRFRVFGLRVFGFGFFWVWGFWVQGFWLQGFGLQGFGVLEFRFFGGLGSLGCLGFFRV